MLPKNKTITTTSNIVDTLGICWQDPKVAVEIIAMVTDAGLIPIKPLICITRTEHGADNIILAESVNRKKILQHENNLYDNQTKRMVKIGRFIVH